MVRSDSTRCESIRRFDVDTQRSVLKVNEVHVMPLIEYPRSRKLFHDIAEKIDYQGVASPGDSFPGWEFLVPLVHPRSHSILSFSEHAIVVLDEPEAIASAADRLWKRLEDPDKKNLIAPEANFFSWGELQATIGQRTELARDVGEPRVAADRDVD